MRRQLLFILLFSAVLFSGCSMPSEDQSPAVPAPQSPGTLILAGGGAEQDRPDSWSHALYGEAVRLCSNKRFAILSAAVETDWLPRYLRNLGAVSAENVCIPDVTTATAPGLYNQLVACDGIFIKGGNQAVYYQAWRDTPVSRAIRHVYNHGGVIAGTSAGAAILSEIIYSAEKNSLTSEHALQDSFHPDITLRNDFLGLLSGTLVDTHFTQRGRLLRLTVLLARAARDFSSSYLGIGLDDCSGIAVSPDGTARVMGAGSVSFVFRGAGKQTVLSRGLPPTITDTIVYQLTAGFSIDINSRKILQVPENAKKHKPLPVRTAYSSQILSVSGNSEGAAVLGAVRLKNPQLPNALYYGRLDLIPGQAQIPESIVMPRLFSVYEETENRLGGAQLALQQHPGYLAVLLPRHSICMTSDSGLIRCISPGSPVIIMDSATMTWYGSSTYVSDASVSPFCRQSVALAGVRLHIFNEKEYYNPILLKVETQHD